MKKLAVITARGGSKRIPRKNIKNFCGKPIIAYSIEAALSSGIFDTVMVSTDDAEIAEIAKQYGAEVPFLRSAETSNDFATTGDVIQEVLDSYEERGVHYDVVCCIYPTAPLLKATRLRTAVELLQQMRVDSVIPVVRFGFPPQRSVVIQEGVINFKWPEHALTRSQDLEPFYHDAGQFYCLCTESFLRERRLVMSKTAPLVLSEMEVQDIDTQEDWEIAELKYRMLSEKEQNGN